MIQRHEQRVDNNAKRDKQLCERIKHDRRNAFLELQPAKAAVPDAEGFDALEHIFDHFLFECRSVLIVLFFCRKVVDRH